MLVMVVPVQAHRAGWWLRGVGESQPNMALGHSCLRGLHNALFECHRLVDGVSCCCLGGLCKCVP